MSADNTIHQFAIAPLGLQNRSIRRTNARTIGGKFRRTLPGSIGVAVEIDPRSRVRVHSPKANADRWCGMRRCWRRAGSECDHTEYGGEDDAAGHMRSPETLLRKQLSRWPAASKPSSR